MTKFEAIVTDQDIADSKFAYPDELLENPTDLLGWARRTAYFLFASDRALRQANEAIAVLESQKASSEKPITP